MTFLKEGLSIGKVNYVLSKLEVANESKKFS